MNTWKDSGVVNFTAGEDLAANRNVTLSSGTVLYADAGETAVGTTVNTAVSGKEVSVKLFRNATGTFCMASAAAITANAVVYGADDGKIDDTATGKAIGIAMEAASAADKNIEVVLIETAAATIADISVTATSPTWGDTTSVDQSTNLATFSDAVVADLASIETIVNAAIAALEKAGVILNA